MSPNFTQFTEAAENYLKEKQRVFLDEFKLEDFNKWSLDQHAGTLIFSNNTQIKIELQIQIAGLWSPASKNWVWAWAIDTLGEKVKADSKRIRAIGKKYRFNKLVEEKWHAEKQDAWKMTAILAKEVKAIGSCRTKVNNKVLYMVVKKARSVNKSRLLNLFTKR